MTLAELVLWDIEAMERNAVLVIGDVSPALRLGLYLYRAAWRRERGVA